MNSTLRIIILGLLTPLLIAAAAFELAFINRLEKEAAEIYLAAESRSGSDAVSQSIRAIQSDHAAELKTLEGVAISGSEIVSLVGLLEQAGEDMGLAVTIASISSEAKTGATTSPETFKVVVDALGPWSSSLAFTRLIGSLPYKASVESLNLNLSEGSWRTGAVLKVTVFPEDI